MKANSTKGALVVYTTLAMVQRSMSLLLLPFVTRAMPVDEYGMVSIIAAIGMFASVLLSAAVEQAVFRAAARVGMDPAQRSVLSAAAVWLGLLAPGVCILAAGLVYMANFRVFHIPAAYSALELVAVGIGLFSGAYVQSCLRAQQELRSFVVMSGTTIVVGAASKLGFVVVAEQGVRGWVISDLVTAGVSLIVSLMFFRPESLKLCRQGLRPLAQFAIPIVPHVIAFWALASLSRPLMATVLPLSDVGSFAVAFNAANVGMLLVIEVNRAVAVDYAADSLPGPSRRLSKIVRMQLLLATLAPALVCIASRPFAAWVIPSAEYTDVVPILAILAVAPYLWTVYVLAINFVTMTAGRPSWNWVASVSGTAVMALGTIFLGSSIGVKGVAIAQVICYGVMAVISHSICRRMGLGIDWKISGLTWVWWGLSSLAVAVAVVPTYLQVSNIAWIFSLIVSVATIVVLAVVTISDRTNKRLVS